MVPSATVTATPEPAPWPTATTEPTPVPTETPEPTSTPEPSATPEPTATPEVRYPPANDDGRVRALRTPTDVVLSVLGVVDGAWEVVTPCNNTILVTGGEPITGAQILLDPGHGGSETGAVGPGGTREADLNLVVARELRAVLEAKGLSVLMTRDADYRMAIAARAQLTNSVDPLVFLSIHHNGGSTLEQDFAPTEVFFQLGSTEGERLSTLVHEELRAVLDPLQQVWQASPFSGAQFRLNDEDQDLYGVLRLSPDVVSILIEPLYLDNAPQEELLNDPGLSTLEAEAIGEAVSRWLLTDDVGTGLVEGDNFTLGTSTGGTDGCEDPPLR